MSKRVSEGTGKSGREGEEERMGRNKGMIERVDERAMKGKKMEEIRGTAAERERERQNELENR
ncbi:MAG: hypothetical protein ACRCR2_01570 [Fusobacteriaceae bacterium]